MTRPPATLAQLRSMLVELRGENAAALVEIMHKLDEVCRGVRGLLILDRRRRRQRSAKSR